MLSACHPVPHPPKLLHLLRRAQRDPGISVERRKGTADGDILLPEFRDQTAYGTPRLHHDEVSGGRNRFQLAGCGLAHELVAISGVTLYSPAVAGRIVHRR